MNLERELVRSAEAIEQQMRRHRRMICLALDGGDGTEIDSLSTDACPRSYLLRQVLVETIEVLESTRKSFKSKQLESLRRKLTRVLAEVA